MVILSSESCLRQRSNNKGRDSGGWLHGGSGSKIGLSLFKKVGEMGSVGNICFPSVFRAPMDTQVVWKQMKNKSTCSLMLPLNHAARFSPIFCKLSESGIEENPTSKRESKSKDRMEDYNTAMKRMMRNPYEYHHDLGMNYTLITDNLIVGSQPQKPEDIDHLKKEEGVAFILNLQQDKDVEYWGIDLQSILRRCRELEIGHMRRPAKDFDPDSLRNELPKAVSSLEWAISEGKGRVYVHCTAGLGRAPAVAIAYMFWFCGMTLNTAYDMLTSKRPCGPNKRAIRGATYDLAKNDPWKEPFESLPEHAFEDIADWERNLIQDRVYSLRGT
ncbi:hypothetical protein RJT34_12932 [Clitoria ternatea]|uniref:Phosphoglucan phosphatase LSF2, chloroplastic n=1 Tax=Clitoria ternatea TaxID=43366 RepID=A0AAN9JQA9_CLITE